MIEHFDNVKLSIKKNWDLLVTNWAWIIKTRQQVTKSFVRFSLDRFYITRPRFMSDVPKILCIILAFSHPLAPKKKLVKEGKWSPPTLNRWDDINWDLKIV